jgi:hypothetical protein
MDRTIGGIRDSTESYASGLYFLAACAFASGIIALFVLRPAAAASERQAV